MVGIYLPNPVLKAELERSKQRLHSLRGDRLCQVMVAPCFEGTASVFLLTPTGYCNKGNAATPWRPANPRCQIVPVKVWETDMESGPFRVLRCDADSFGAGPQL